VAVSPAPALDASSASGGLALDQVQALTQQQQRILSRSILVACALKAETPDRAVLDGALADLLADITEAAFSIGVILQAQQCGTVTPNCRAERPKVVLCRPTIRGKIPNRPIGTVR
jgi:hypothetical protein